MTLHARLKELVADLKKHPQVDVHATKLGRATSLGAAKGAAKNWAKSFAVPLDVVQFSPSEPIYLRYVAEVDGSRIGGEFNLYSVISVLINTRNAGLAWEGITEPERELVDNLRVFDDHPRSGDGKLAAFFVPPPERKRRPMPDLYFFDCGDCRKLAVDYAGYIEGLIATAAVSNWQCLYLAEPRREEWIFDDLSAALALVRRLLPERDWSEFAQRVDRLGAAL